jgi:hypothetical protein
MKINSSRECVGIGEKIQLEMIKYGNKNIFKTKTVYFAR